MKLSITLIALAALLLSCKKEDILIQGNWTGSSQLPVLNELVFPDSVLIRPDPFNDSIPWISKGLYFHMNFKEDFTVHCSQEVDTLVQIGFNEIDGFIIPQFKISSGLYEFPIYNWGYDKKTKKLTVFRGEKRAIYNVTTLHGQIMGGSGPRLTLNDTLKYDEGD